MSERTSLPVPLFVELLDRAGHVVTRHRVDALPARLGRGYDNDVIVDDPFVAPTHLTIELDADGRPVARDAGTVNGLHIAGGKRAKPGIYRGAAAAPILLAPDLVLRAGHTYVRVRRADHPVAVERADRAAHAWEGARLGLPALGIAVLLGLLDAWLGDVGTGNRVGYATTAIGVASLALTWAVLWSLLNRLFAGQMRFGRHLMIGALALVSIKVVVTLAGVAGYALSITALGTSPLYLTTLTAAVFVYLGTLTVRPAAPRTARTVAAGFAVIGIGLVALLRYQADHTIAESRYLSTLYGPALRLTPPVDSASFVQRLDALAAEAQARRDDAADDDPP